MKTPTEDDVATVNTKDPTDGAELSTKAQRTAVSEAASAATAVVGCKIANGLHLRLFDTVMIWESAPIGGREVPTAIPRPVHHKLTGCAINIEKMKKGDTPFMIGGYAVTTIPRDFMEEWEKQNRGADFLVNGLVLWGRDEVELRAKIADNKGRRSGLEPIDPEHPATISPEVRGIQVAERPSS